MFRPLAGPTSTRSILGGDPEAQIYLYRFDQIGSFSLSDVFTDSPLAAAWTFAKKFFGLHHTKGLGAAHGDDLLYLFRLYMGVWRQ